MSDTFYKSMQLRCAVDGVTRAVRVLCYRYDGSFACDTFYSVPANTRINGKYAHGFVTIASNGADEFRIHDSSRAKLGFSKPSLVEIQDKVAEKFRDGWICGGRVI